MSKTERHRRVSKFELHDLIGEGAMGVVWKAYDPVIRRYVALKLLSNRIGKTTDARQRFLREGRAAGVLQHPNVVTLYDLGEAESHLYIAMELVEGHDLSELIASNEPWTLERKLDIAMEILEGLAYAHERGVIHRDIKPSNIRLTADGHVKIMDFGIARLESAEATGSGAIMGTPSYMAPEQVTNGRITAATDLFAVGCLLYELLSHQKPFYGETVHGVLYQVLTTEPKPLRTLEPSVPAALERVIGKAMSKTPEARYQSARQMQQALASIRSALVGATDTTQRLTPTWATLPSPALRLVTHIPLRWRIVVLSALAVVVLLLAYDSRGRETPVASPAAPPAAAASSAPLSPGLAATLDEMVAAPPPAGINSALIALRDSALAQRDRAQRAGAMKNNVHSLVLAETMLQTAEHALRSGDHARASSGYLGAVPEYRKARAEAEKLRGEAKAAIARATPVVKGLATRSQAMGAAASLARAESLFSAMDYSLATLAARDAEQAGVAAGVAPPSPQPADPRAAIATLLLDLERAVASERAANLKVLFPSMTQRDAAQWRSFFRRATQLQATFAADDLQIRGHSASATVQAQYRFIPTGGGTQREERSRLAMQFLNTPVGWRIAAVEEAKK